MQFLVLWTNALAMVQWTIEMAVRRPSCAAISQKPLDECS